MEIKDSLFIFAIIYKIKARMIVSYKVQSYKRQRQTTASDLTDAVMPVLSSRGQQRAAELRGVGGSSNRRSTCCT